MFLDPIPRYWLIYWRKRWNMATAKASNLLSISGVKSLPHYRVGVESVRASGVYIARCAPAPLKKRWVADRVRQSGRQPHARAGAHRAAVLVKRWSRVRRFGRLSGQGICLFIGST